MNRLALTSTTFAFLAVLGSSALPAHAVTLGSLISTSTPFTDLFGNRYSNFNFVNSTHIPASDVSLTADQITVNQVPINIGFGIEFGGSFNAKAGQINDYIISYNVTAAPKSGINGIGLATNGSADPGTTALVNDTVYDANNQIGSLVSKYPPNGPGKSFNQIFTNNYSSLLVQKDINLDGSASSDPNSLASISIIDQTVTNENSNIPVLTPEPSEVLGTLAFGAIGVFSYLRRLQSSK